MLLNKRQFNWVSSVFNNLPVITKYFQTCSQCILKECRQKYTRRHVKIVSYKLIRKPRNKSKSKWIIIKYNTIKIRGGFGRKPLRKLKKKRKQRKPKKIRKEPKYKQKSPLKSPIKPSTSVAPSNGLSLSIDPTDDVEFMYYQSSDEEAADIAIVNSSDIEIPSFFTEDDVVVQAPSLQPSTTFNKTNNSTETEKTDSINKKLDCDDANEPSSENEKNCDVPRLKASEVNDRLRQQLELLKKGKGDVSLLGSRKSERILFSQQNSRVTSPSVSRRSSGNDDKTNRLKLIIRTSTPKNASPLKKAVRNNSSDTIDTTVRSTGFIDSLINKLKSRGSSNESIVANQSNTNNIKRSYTTRSTRSDAIRNENTDIADPSPKDKQKLSKCSDNGNCSSPDFRGFDNCTKGSVSDLLSTPRIGKEPDKKSVFVSEELDTFMKENALENLAKVPLPLVKQTYDEALITADAEPPSMKLPHRYSNMERPRTLAEKRFLFEKKKDYKYRMIENENTIYHEMKKRTKEGLRFDNSLLKGIFDGQIPFTRDCWRATCWLNTDHNKFFFQTIRHDGSEIKVFGGRGNNDRKTLCEIVSGTKDKNNICSKLQKQKAIRCSRLCRPVDKVKINNLEEYMQQLNGDIKKEKFEELTDMEVSKKIQMLPDSPRRYVKPGPLCSKVAPKRCSFEAEYGPFQKFTLPTVQLEVWPKFEKPLPPFIQPYMKLILPFENITDEWAKFAVSALKVPETRRRNSRILKKFETDDNKSFVFDIPYENDQKKILVRRRRMHNHWEPFPLQEKYSYSFRKKVDPSNELEVECANILAKIITSVAITANENSFIKSDPDIDYVGKLVPIGSKTLLPKLGKSKLLSPSGDGAKTLQKNKIMKELRRLNATIIDASVPAPKELCREPFCRMGCICESISTVNTVSVHCQEVGCMFECNCTPINQLTCPSSVSTAHGNINQLRAKATARLAKEEKDFTSTVVLSDDNMFVLPNINGLGKRNKKKPKRFNECLFMDGSMDFVDLGEEAVADEPQQKPVAFDTSAEVDRLRHVRVFIPKIDAVKKLEPFCMMHCLYRCFCKGTATDGEPLPLSENQNATESNPLASLDYYGGWVAAPPRKRQYTFEREEANTPKNLQVSNEKSTALLNGTHLKYHDDIRQSARTRPIRTHRSFTEHEWKMLRRKCVSQEAPLRKRLILLRQKCQNFRDPAKKKSDIKIVLGKVTTVTASVPSTSSSSTTLSSIAAPLPSIAASTSVVSSAPRGTPLSSARLLSTALNNHRLRIANLNRIVTATMHKVREKQISDSFDLPHPFQTILLCKSWQQLLKAYREEKIFIWILNYGEDKTEMIITLSNEMPLIDELVTGANIKDTDNESLPLLGKLIKSFIENDQTKQFAVLMQSRPTYWTIVGAMHSTQQYIDSGCNAIPTPKTHPELSQKISQLFQIMQSKNLFGETNNGYKVSPSPSEVVSIDLDSDSSIDDSVAKNKVIKPSGITKMVNGQLKTGGNLRKRAKITFKKPITNIPLTNPPTQPLQIPLLPISITALEEWFMLNIEDDFTHIFFPSTKKFLSLDLIAISLKMSASRKKTLLITQPHFYPHVYATPAYENKIILGPYRRRLDMNICLFRRINGKMILLETIEKDQGYKIQNRSTGCWIRVANSNLNENILPEHIGNIIGSERSQSSENQLVALSVEPVLETPTRTLTTQPKIIKSPHVGSVPIITHIKKKSVSLSTAPVTSAPDNQLKIQGVFSIQPSAMASLSQDATAKQALSKQQQALVEKIASNSILNAKGLPVLSRSFFGQSIILKPSSNSMLSKKIFINNGSVSNVPALVPTIKTVQSLATSGNMNNPGKVSGILINNVSQGVSSTNIQPSGFVISRSTQNLGKNNMDKATKSKVVNVQASTTDSNKQNLLLFKDKQGRVTVKNNGSLAQLTPITTTAAAAAVSNCNQILPSNIANVVSSGTNSIQQNNTTGVTTTVTSNPRPMTTKPNSINSDIPAAIKPMPALIKAPLPKTQIPPPPVQPSKPVKQTSPEKFQIRLPMKRKLSNESKVTVVPEVLKPISDTTLQARLSDVTIRSEKLSTEIKDKAIPSNTKDNTIEIIDLSDEEDASANDYPEQQAKERKSTQSQPLASSSERKTAAPLLITNINDSVEGFIISNNVALGKLSAKLQYNCIRVEVPDLSSKIKISMKGQRDLSNLDNYLDKYFRQRVYAFYPERIKLRWKFVTEDDEKHQQYQLLTKKTYASLGLSVIMADRLIDLRLNEEATNGLCLQDDFCIGTLRLASYLMSKNQARETTADLILEKAKNSIQELIKSAKSEKDKQNVQQIITLRRQLLQKHTILMSKLKTAFGNNATSSTPAKVEQSSTGSTKKRQFQAANSSQLKDNDTISQKTACPDNDTVRKKPLIANDASKGNLQDIVIDNKLDDLKITIRKSSLTVVDKKKTTNGKSKFNRNEIIMIDDD